MNISFDDQNRKRRRMGNRKVAAEWDSKHPFMKNGKVFIDAGIKEIKEFGVMCDEELPCGCSVHGLSMFGACDLFGSTLLDVYSVKITVKDRNKFPGSSLRVHGAIRTYDAYETPCPHNELYDVKRDEYRALFPDDELWYDVKSDEPEYIHLDPTGSATLSLSGPKTRLPSIDITLAITFALKLDCEDIFNPADACFGALKMTNRFISYAVGDEHFAAGTVLFTTGFTSIGNYSALGSQLVWGLISAGTDPVDYWGVSYIPALVEINYALLPRGVMAKVHVTILGQHVDKVWGCIRARPCVFPEKIVLFDKKQTESVTVEPQSHSILLTRSLVGVPSNSFLIIEAHLHDANGDLIVNETSFFRACNTGRFRSTFKTVKFEVEWSE